MWGNEPPIGQSFVCRTIIDVTPKEKWYEYYFK